MGPGFEPQPNHTQSFKSILFFEDAFLHLLVPRPKRSGAWVRAPAESQLSVLIREQGVETWLEASTERSESNSGRSLGIYTAYSDSCLEDSTSHRVKHPLNPLSMLISKFFDHYFQFILRFYIQG